MNNQPKNRDPGGACLRGSSLRGLPLSLPRDPPITLPQPLGLEVGGGGPRPSQGKGGMDGGFEDPRGGEAARCDILLGTPPIQTLACATSAASGLVCVEYCESASQWFHRQQQSCIFLFLQISQSVVSLSNLTRIRRPGQGRDRRGIAGKTTSQ